MVDQQNRTDKAWAEKHRPRNRETGTEDAIRTSPSKRPHIRDYSSRSKRG